jgi:hypothetical protein
MPVAYIRLKLISGRYLGLRCKDILMLHIEKCIQYTQYFIKLNNSVI